MNTYRDVIHQTHTTTSYDVAYFAGETRDGGIWHWESFATEPERDAQEARWRADGRSISRGKTVRRWASERELFGLEGIDVEEGAILVGAGSTVEWMGPCVGESPEGLIIESPMTGATRAIPRARCGIMRAVHFPLDGKQELKSHGRWL